MAYKRFDTSFRKIFCYAHKSMTQFIRRGVWNTIHFAIFVPSASIILLCDDFKNRPIGICRTDTLLILTEDKNVHSSNGCAKITKIEVGNTDFLLTFSFIIMAKGHIILKNTTLSR